MKSSISYSIINFITCFITFITNSMVQHSNQIYSLLLNINFSYPRGKCSQLSLCIPFSIAFLIWNSLERFIIDFCFCRSRCTNWCGPHGAHDQHTCSMQHGTNLHRLQLVATGRQLRVSNCSSASVASVSIFVSESIWNASRTA